MITPKVMMLILCILLIILGVFIYNYTVTWTIEDKKKLSRRIRDSLRDAIKKEIDYDISQAEPKIEISNDQFNSVFDATITESVTDCMVNEIALNYSKYSVDKYLSLQNTKDINKEFIAFVENTRTKCGEAQAENDLHTQLGLTHIISPTPPIPAIIAVKFF